MKLIAKMVLAKKGWGHRQLIRCIASPLQWVLQSPFPKRDSQWAEWVRSSRWRRSTTTSSLMKRFFSILWRRIRYRDIMTFNLARLEGEVRWVTYLQTLLSKSYLKRRYDSKGTGRLAKLPSWQASTPKNLWQQTEWLKRRFPPIITPENRKVRF